MNFRNFDGLRIFNRVAQARSLTNAAEELCLTKSAISYQVNKLESELGFNIFKRGRNGVQLTHKGAALLQVTQTNLQNISDCIEELREQRQAILHIRLSTYFASRWLTAKLMDFMRQHPEIRIAIEPAIDPGEFKAIHDTVAIRWGTGDWLGTHNELLFKSHSIPVASPKLAALAKQEGLVKFFTNVTLLQDSEASQAWHKWFALSEYQYSHSFDRLVIKDPNVRVEAVANGQGVALYDQLLQSDLDNGSLVALSAIALQGYGYHLCYPNDLLQYPPARAFRDWILQQIDG